MKLDISNTMENVKEGITDIGDNLQENVNDFHDKYISKVTPDCGKYGNVAKFAVEMVPGVSEYNAIREGDWTAFAIAAGLDLAAIGVGVFTLGSGYGVIKGGSSLAKEGVKNSS